MSASAAKQKARIHFPPRDTTRNSIGLHARQLLGCTVWLARAALLARSVAGADAGVFASAAKAGQAKAKKACEVTLRATTWGIATRRFIAGLDMEAFSAARRTTSLCMPAQMTTLRARFACVSRATTYPRIGRHPKQVGSASWSAARRVPMPRPKISS